MLSWNRIKLDQADFLFKHCRSEDTYSFYLTDMVYIYQEILSQDEINSRLQELNPDLEGFSAEDVVKDVCAAVLNNNSLTRTIKEDVYEFSLSWDNDGIPLVWTFYLRRGTAKMFSEIFTNQIIQSIDGLLEERKQLFKIIRDKDLELGEYKNSGVKITRPQLKTERFKEEKFLTNPLPASSRSGLEILCSSDTLNLIQRITENNSDVTKPDTDISKQETALKRPLKPVKTSPEPLQIKKEGFKRSVITINMKKSELKKKLRKL
ncbi:uncharacterized protein LOC111696784 isoform X2 [Eurytemora carolleeae]|uniref:uncharacterized protein LOC111696784 isoform X2 n=1 Tax=Eurytemora carolleeae TaxID=1294199 RepID=UPI000C7610D8|nr:uncharacterized protein LOC111696784 isoform X2 [Eurytemora carolleeae]|eukprot:XP_023322283.1 uncharacterized protein LOC111696784 isoform X2 [Eurytemora affinis]